MKAEELRIGNYVNYNDGSGHDDIRKVVGIDQNSVTSIVKGCHFATAIRSNDLIYPIPLSEDVLLKFGFEKVEVEIEDYYSCTYEKQLNNDVFISYADDFSCTLYWNKKESINGFGVIPNWHSINTVHGLQNLCYILTGEELEVSL